MDNNVVKSQRQHQLSYTINSLLRTPHSHRVNTYRGLS